MQYDRIFDSSSNSSGKSFEIEDKNSIVIFFEKEQIVLYVDTDGNAVFSTVDGAELYKTKAEETDRRYLDFFCQVIDNTITVKFRTVKYIDHYPHCDGEHDRWSTIIVSESPVSYTIADT